ncbi:MAG: type II toxin-antitoxin system RelE/ParE family toxin [Bdellovibrionales bacterium]|nr:type II toxin-antitoxin system RelE/ParE family toxin [Bdellovibrionales bacterium]
MNREKWEVFEYVSESGSCPFQEWLENLKDIKGRAIIRKKINLLRLGYFSDSRSLGDGLFEIRIFFGPGYRVYFGKQRKKIVILLWGGKKDSQKRDIKKAQRYWKVYSK